MQVMNRQVRRQQWLQFNSVVWFQKHRQVGKGGIFSSLHAQLFRLFIQWWLLFHPNKSPGDEGGAAHKGSWQTRKMCSISLGQDDISVAALRVAGKREKVFRKPLREPICLCCI